MTVIIKKPGTTTEALRRLLTGVNNPFAAGDTVGIKDPLGGEGESQFSAPAIHAGNRPVAS